MRDIRKRLDAMLGGGKEAAPTPEESPTAPPAPIGTPPVQTPEGLREKLAALLSRNKGIMQGSEWKVKAAEAIQQRIEDALEIDQVVPGEVITDEDGGFYLARTDFPLDHLHGFIYLREVLDVLPEHIGLSACDTELEDFDARSAVFLDTETTGLSGGTGTVAFLIGVGYIVGDVFRLDQCFMRDYDDEAAILTHIAGICAPGRVVVSYNGKSFDIPLLLTRYIQNRMRPPFDGMPHLDLVHAARRFWKGRLRDCGLGNMERSVLGIQREGDIPSAEIPAIWLEYIRTRDARKLEKVFYHHRMDILSLVTLTAKMSANLDAAREGILDHAQDHLAVVWLFFRQKRYEEAADQGRRLLQTEMEDAQRRRCHEIIALACKRSNDFEGMAEAWRGCLRDHPDNLLALAELAKHLEHREREWPEALRLCETALDHLRARDEAFADSLEARAFEHRATRLRAKLERAGGGV